jgi:hypothetical protein
MAQVALHVWRVPRRALPAVLHRMAVDRARLRATPGVRFAKLMGTGTGRAFGPSDADLFRWAALVVSDGPVDDTPVVHAWNRLSTAHARVDLEPIASRGTWSGAEPFAPTGRRPAGPVLALTRARLRPRRILTFWRAVPPVVAELHRAPGLLARFGIGEAPIGWQGTVSVWRSPADLVGFAYRQPEHRAAIARTVHTGWYAEELFARFAVCGVTGDRRVLDWRTEEDHDEG